MQALQLSYSKDKLICTYKNESGPVVSYVHLEIVGWLHSRNKINRLGNVFRRKNSLDSR